MAIDLARTLEALIAPALIFVGGAIAKFLRDISVELAGIKTAMAVTTNRVDAHEDALMVHDGRIRSLETRRGK